MAEAESWPSIRKHGLLSTTALLDLFEINGNQRKVIESRHRPKSVEITHPKHGTAVIRDQIPMRESALKKCLQDCSPQQWYEFLNRKVFFWVTEERVRTLLKARAYRSKEHLVITVNSSQLLAQHEGRTLLSPINSGSTIYRPVERSLTTFKTLIEYPYHERRRLRGAAHAIAEAAIDYSVPNLKLFVERVERRRCDRVIESIYLNSRV